MMLFLKRQAANKHPRLKQRRRGIRRRKTDTKLRLRAGFRAAFLHSIDLRPEKDDEPLSKIEWLDTLVLSTAVEASKYKYKDRDGREVSPRRALERTSELAWDWNEPQLLDQSHGYSTSENAKRMIEATVDYLLARCRVSEIDRRASGERRA